MWRALESADIDATINSWETSTGVTAEQVFESLAIRRLDVNVAAPSSFTLNASAQSGSIDLSWSRPSAGDYQVYNTILER